MAKGARILGLLGALGVIQGATGCGDRAGDPVVPLESARTPSTHFPDSDSVVIQGGPCTPCNSEPDECGGHDDLCLENQQTKERFCAIECDNDGSNCPSGYRCVGISNSLPSQCVPETDDCSHVMASLAPELDVMRAEALHQINHLRAEISLPPFAPSDCLNRLAQDSAFELSQTGDVNGKFERECEQIRPDPCECGWTANAERRTIALGLTWAEAVDRLIDRGRDPDDPMSAYVSWPEHGHAGFGIVLSGDAAWTSISFGR